MTSATAEPLLRARGISKHFGGEAALTEVDLDIYPGEVLALLGANGAGKSTLIKIITGVHRPDGGEIRWKGEPVAVRSVAHSISLGIATMFQQLNVPEDLTVGEYVTLGREIRRGGILNRGANAEAARTALAELDIDLDPRRECGSLTVAERELVEIVRAVSVDARLVIMDEPTASLGLAEVERLFTVIRRLQERNVAVLYVSHKLEEVLEITDRSVVLKDGRNAGELETAQASEDKLLELMVGAYARSEGRAETHEVSEVPVLELENFSTATGVSDVSLTLHDGEILGIYGLMGAGRTELLRALYGLDPVASGSITLRGTVTEISSPAVARRLGFGFVPEDRIREAIIGEETVAGNLTLAAPEVTGKAGLYSLAASRRAASEAVSAIGIKTAGVDAPITSLSGGNQQKVVFGRWVVAESTILLLDDPTVGVDVAAKHEIYALIRSLTTQGMSVIVCSSELPELLHLCDRIAVMHRKKIVSVTSRAEVNPDTLIRQSIVGVGADTDETQGERP